MEKNNYEFLGAKGEWRIASKRKESQFYVIQGIDTPTHEVQVCCLNYGAHPIQEQLDCTEANAHLIAAAPDLLEACIKILDTIRRDSLEEQLNLEEYNYLEQAIHKALNIK